MPTIRHRLGALVAAGFGLFLATAPAAAQPRTATITSGTVSCPVVNCLQLSLTDDIAGVGIDVTGTGTWELVVEGIRGPASAATWRTAPTVADADLSVITTITAAGSFSTANTGFSAIRIYPSSWTSGNPVISVTPGGSGAGASSGGGGGAVTNAGLTELAAAINSNLVDVNIVSGAGSGGTAAVDNSAFTFGTTNVTPAGFVFDDTAPNAATENRIAAPRMSSNRVSYGIIRDAAGNERGLNVAADGSIAVTMGAVPTGGATAALQTTANGYLDGLEGQLTTLDGRVDGLEALITTTNANVAAVTAQLATNFGAASVVSADPCDGSAKTVHVVNTSTATTVEIANAVSGQFFYICSINLVAAGAQTVAIVEDDTDGVGSPTAGLNGGTAASAGWSFAANGGIALGNGGSTVMKTGTANRYLGIITGQAVQLSGTITYVSAP